MDGQVGSAELTATESELALCRSIFYNALSLGFRPPTEETLTRLGSPEAAEALAEAAGPLDPQGEHDLPPLVRKLAQTKDSQDLDALSESFSTLFGHTARGTVPPYETEYGAGAPFLQPQEMGDIAGFMRAFGLVLDTGSHERIDHISCECEFLYFLCQKEAYALEHDDAEMVEETRKAQRLFLRDHLGQFGGAFGRRLMHEDRDGFLGTLGQLCSAFVEAEGRRLDVPVGPEHLQLRPESVDDAPMACASCAFAPATGEIPGLENGD